MKKDFEKMSLIDLTNRLNQIDAEKRELDIEYNKIVHELWDRIPSLKDDVNMQPKVLKKEMTDERNTIEA